VQALASGSLVSDASEKAQWKTLPVSADAPQWQGYGLGASSIGPLRGGSASMGGYLTAAYSDPKSGLTVVVMLNNATAGVEFVKSFALELASLGARTEPASGSGNTKPAIELPWSAEQMAEALTAGAVCQPVPAS
jgi:D-alanyl-D-alanine carboxypeptidase